MTNDGAKFQKREYETDCEAWFKAHGFAVRYLRQYKMTTKFELSKDGLTYPVTISAAYLENGVDNYLQNIERNHEMKKEILEMKRQLAAKEA